MSPGPRLAFLSQSEESLVAQQLMDAGPNPSLAASYCESDRLFERLDRRRSSESADKEVKKTRRAIRPVSSVPALP